MISGLTGPDGMTPAKNQVSLDLSTATDIRCDKCGNYTFQEVALMKHFSALVSPSGQPLNAPLPTFACCACGHVNLGFLPPALRPTSDSPKTGGPNLSIVK